MAMFEEVIEKLLSTISEKEIFTETYPKFSGEGYRSYKIDVKNFHEIVPLKYGKKIAFVDGGNAEIISSANFSLSLIRVCYATYRGSKKAGFKKFEFFAFVRAANENKEICYKASFFSLSSGVLPDEISFSSFDPTLMAGINRADIGSVANAVRRLAELRLAKLISDEKTADIIVLDGNLQCTLTNESRYLNELYASCSKNNVILSALSKTTSLFTENGNLLSAVLSGIADAKPWFYHPIADITSSSHRAEMFFAKFHEKSKHVFRLEIFNAQKMKAEETISELAGNCTDPIFIGYPYGLVEADRLARVSNQEKESLKTMLLVKLKSRNIEKYLSSVNAHEILDRISF